uniref:Uncharacterized protein n=1 Tax=Oryza glumipatula TaxID=40148 RepID=A0A0E0BNJ9_9ORYZ
MAHQELEGTAMLQETTLTEAIQMPQLSRPEIPKRNPKQNMTYTDMHKHIPKSINVESVQRNKMKAQVSYEHGPTTDVGEVLADATARHVNMVVRGSP